MALILLFFIISPLLILYTTGYRYDFYNHEIKQTGVISIDIKPEDTTVYLNSVKINEELPMRLTNRAPGNYKIRLEKTGYQSWEKDITVESKRTTYIKDIVLFKDSLPIKTLLNDEETLHEIVPNNDGSFVFAIRKKRGIYEIDLLDTTEKTWVTIDRRSSNIKPIIDWSPYDDYASIIFENDEKKELILLDAHNKAVAKNYELAKNKTYSYQWLKSSLVPTIYIQKNKKISKINTSIELELEYMTKSNIWHIDEQEKLWVYNENKRQLETQNEDLSTTINIDQPVTDILDINNNRIILANENQIIVVELDEDREKRSLELKKYYYNHQTEEWLVWSNNELWSIFQDGTIDLKNRTSKKIEFVRPLDAHGLILIASEGGLYAFNPFYYTTHELFSGGDIQEIGINIETRKIYFLGTVAQSTSLFELEY